MSGMPAASRSCEAPSSKYGRLPSGVLMTSVDLAVFHQVDGVRPALEHLETWSARQIVGAQERRGAAGCDASGSPSRPARARSGERCGLSRSLTVTNAVPLSGSLSPRSVAMASRRPTPKSSANPMTSPVLRISGPRTGSSPGNFGEREDREALTKRPLSFGSSTEPEIGECRA